MQTNTPIATHHRGNSESCPVHLIVGSTLGVELPALLTVLNDMGGQVLSPDITPCWQALLANSNRAATDMKELENALESARKPALLPVTFDIGLASLKQVMKNLDDVALLLFYSRPEPFLVSAMSAEKNAPMALEEWCTASRRMLEAIHSYRSRAVLFNVDSAFRSAAAFKDVCWKRFRLKGLSEDVVSVTAQKPVAEIHRLIAAQMVVQSADVQELLDELEASAVPADTLSELPEVNCEDVLAEWRRQGESDQLKEENELLLLQLHQVQEELEGYYLQLRESEKKLISRNSMINKRNKTLEDNEKRDKAVRAKVEELERDLAETRNTLTRIRQSLSWKVTKPLRDIRALSRRPFRKQGPD